MKQFVVATISLERAQAAIDSLVEQEFSEKSISLIASDVEQVRNIIDDGGPFKGVTLQTLPSVLFQFEITHSSGYMNAFAKGQAIIAVACSNNTCEAIKETLQDNDAQEVIVVH